MTTKSNGGSKAGDKGKSASPISDQVKETTMTNAEQLTKSDDSVVPFVTDDPSGIPGDTQVAESVVSAVVGHAASQVEGVVRVGSEGALLGLRRFAMSTASRKEQGVDVEAGRKEAILDIDLTVMYGYSIPEIIRGVRESIATDLLEQVGLVAKEINVKIASIEFPDNIPSGRVE